MIINGQDVPRPESYPGSRSYGRTIRARRIRAGLTLRRCADAIGVSMTELSAIERGERQMAPAELERFNAAAR